MSLYRLILASLVYHGRSNLAVALGVAVGTAVLTGALLVGDSMRGSLRHMTWDRLGRIDEVLVADRFFRAMLADELAAESQFRAYFDRAVPAILLRASLENADTQPAARANRVNLVGCDKRFWQLGSGGPMKPVEKHQVVLNEPLARQLGVTVGDRVIVYLPRVTTVPADNPLGRKTETVEGHPLLVGAIVPAQGLGRFSLHASQQQPRNAYVSLSWLQERLEQFEMCNAILVAAGSQREPTPESEGVLQGLLKPSLIDYGIQVKRTARGYFSIFSDRMILDPGAQAAIERSLRGIEVHPVMTYLANTIACGKREIPYSTVAALDFSDKPPLGPLMSVDGKRIGPLADDQIVLNSWAADDLKARPGDTIRLTWFEPESVDGQVREQSKEFRLAAVAQLRDVAADPALTPEVRGVTDQRSVNDWDPPFPFDAKRIRPKDDDYWRDHRATPKAFMSQAAGRIWASRFGHATSLAIQPDGKIDLQVLEGRIALDPAPMGFVFQPVKREGLAASAGTTPFGVLFLAFSFFVIAAAVMLVVLLFRLGTDRRAEQLGILLAIGFRRRQVVRLLAIEGALVAAIASLAGVLLGVGYAAGMLAGLRTWWRSAVSTNMLWLYVTPESLAVGYASGVVLAALAILWAVRRAGRLAPRQLLAGQASEENPKLGVRPRNANKTAGILLVVAVGLSLVAMLLGEEARAGAFFTAGALVLGACMEWIWSALRAGRTGSMAAVGKGNLRRMALRNAARNPARSTLTIGLVAAASFLMIAVSGFRIDPATQGVGLYSGSGGFALVGESDQPIYQDINSAEGQYDLGFSAADSRYLKGAAVFALRVKPGDDASCRNLYQPRQPRILGVPPAMIQRGGFRFADHQRGSQAEQRNPWLLLERHLGADKDGTPRVPVILDEATAKYALHLWKGVGQSYDATDGRGGPLRLEVVALLSQSALQGDLLISEAAMRRYMPEVNGYRFFLVQTEPQYVPAVRNVLERVLGDYGLGTETTASRLADLLAVQNTYVSTFQSLGGLGLLLGTFGLAAVQLRNILERRRELALLQAVGFRRRSLGWLVMWESGLLLIAGLACGVIAALIALLPHLLAGAASVPWAWAVCTLGLVLGVGFFAAWIAARSVLRAPLLAALRGE